MQTENSKREINIIIATSTAAKYNTANSRKQNQERKVHKNTNLKVTKGKNKNSNQKQRHGEKKRRKKSTNIKSQTHTHTNKKSCNVTTDPMRAQKHLRIARHGRGWIPGFVGDQRSCQWPSCAKSLHQSPWQSYACLGKSNIDALLREHVSLLQGRGWRPS